MTTPLVIIGCGYVGAAVARSALAAGRTVRVCARSTGRLAALGELGAQIKYLDAALPKQLPAAMASMRGGTCLYSIPPIGSVPPGDGPRKAMQAAAGAGITCFIHLSSAGLYGCDPDDEAWIDDTTEVALDDPAMAGVRTDEDAVRAATYDMRSVILRLAPVYGPGRGVRARLRKGDYRLLDGGDHAISRIHVDDVVQIIEAAEARAAHGSTYLCADERPTTQREYATWLCDRMGLPLPPSRALLEPGKPRGSHRNRRVRAERVRQELEVTLRYPTFEAGEAAIEAAEAAEA
ncbi:MAG: NAD(P)H-binding protein [Myxococcales bacterium]|nr:NAD(P)H-binding protein [Myxococcales bacterium]